jgi:NADH-quinone oxidoreductase subunit L
LGVFGAFLTAYYMTRQVFHVFFGNCRLELGKTTGSEQHTVEHAGVPDQEHPKDELAPQPHESPPSMTMPLVILAICSILLGFIGTPSWPWIQHFLDPELQHGEGGGAIGLMVLSSVIVFLGIGIGWWLYGRKPLARPDELDVLERVRPDIFALLKNKYFVDEAYEWTFVGLNRWWAHACAWLDEVVWSGLVQLVSYATIALSWVTSLLDEKVVNGAFDEGCRRVTQGGGWMSRLQDGRIQTYLRVIGLALTVLVLFLIWGCKGQ